MLTNSFLSRWHRPLVIFLTAVIFDLLFWQHSIGLNLTLFLVLIGFLQLVIKGWSNVSVPARASLAGLLIAGAMVYVHHSTTAVFAAIVAAMVTAAFMNQYELRSLFYAMLKFTNDLCTVPVRAWAKAGTAMPELRSASPGWRWGRLSLWPVVVLFIFYQLYRGGNARFGELTAGIFDGFFRKFGELFADIFTLHTLFFLFALALCTTLLIRSGSRTILNWEQQWIDLLLRKKIRRPRWMAPLPLDPLERERRKGIMLLALVNILLIVVNFIDIKWIWFGFTVEEGVSLKAFVHEGTWLLIISILLSIVIMLYLFRGNQNFYWRSGPMKALATLWIAQNFILGISVFLRNYHYISYHGLAYKRIGVIVFLVLVLVGLITLYYKIKERKSFFYLARVNSWAAFAMMIALTLVDWDTFIVRHNLAHQNPAEVDIDNYLSMSDKVLPLLYNDLEMVEKQMEGHRKNRVRWVYYLDPEKFKTALDARSRYFLENYGKKHWLERSLARDRTYAALKQMQDTGQLAINLHPGTSSTQQP